MGRKILGRHCVSDHLGLASTGVTFPRLGGGGLKKEGEILKK